MTPLLVVLAIFAFTVPMPIVIQFLVASVLPLVVALATTKVTAPHVKALVLLGLSIVSSGLTELGAALANHTLFDLGLWLLTAGASFITGAGLHFGLWRPTTVTAKLQAAGRTA